MPWYIVRARGSNFRVQAEDPKGAKKKLSVESHRHIKYDEMESVVLADGPNAPSKSHTVTRKPIPQKAGRSGPRPNLFKGYSGPSKNTR